MIPYDKRQKIRFFIPLFFIAAVGLLGLVVQYLWNWLIAPTFSVTPFSYWQAMGLFVLCRILFGGFRFGPPSRGGGNPAFRQREKWMSMSDEERQQFKSQWEKRCGKRE